MFIHQTAKICRTCFGTVSQSEAWDGGAEIGRLKESRFSVRSEAPAPVRMRICFAPWICHCVMNSELLPGMILWLMFFVQPGHPVPDKKENVHFGRSLFSITWSAGFTSSIRSTELSVFRPLLLQTRHWICSFHSSGFLQRIVWTKRLKSDIIYNL